MTQDKLREETVRANIPNVRVNAYYPRAATPGEISDLHYHDEIEFLPIYEGTFCCTVYGQPWYATAGDVIFINARVPHATSTPTGARSGLLQLREKDFMDSEVARVVRYPARMQSLAETAVHVIRDPSFFATVDDLLQEAERQESAYGMMIRGDLLRILGFLYRAGILSDGARLYETKSVQKILPALTYINEHYADPLTLDEVSALLRFDRSYFCRLFKEAIGATFTEYLGFVRIAKAEVMLARTHDSILDISAAVGFSSVSYFNRTFKRYLKCSPHTYRTAKYCPNM